MVLLIVSGYDLAGQEGEETVKTYHFNGSIEATQNGFSFIPTFSLDKPAAIITLNVGGERFTFEPQFRFDLDGMRPWSIVGFWRYRIINKEKFFVKLGAQFPAFAYQYEEAISGNVPYTKITVQRFAPVDVVSSLKLSDKISLGLFYLHSIGLEKADQLNSADFLSVGPTFSNLKLLEKFRLRWAPQVYYLRIDDNDGFYYTHSVAVSHADFPVAIGSTINQEIASSLNAKSFNWNISLIYSFNNEFEKRRG